MEILEKILKVSDHIVTIFVMVASLGGFIFREKIKTYFNKQLIETQENYKRDLEAYKTNLLQRLEEYKLDIDIRRSLNIEMSHRRLLAYQKTCTAWTHFLILLLQYNESPSIEQMYNIFGQSEPRAWEDLKAFEDNIFFFSKKIIEQAKIFSGDMNDVIRIVRSGESIKPDKLEEYFESLKKLRNAMVSEIFPENIKGNESNN